MPRGLGVVVATVLLVACGPPQRPQGSPTPPVRAMPNPTAATTSPPPTTTAPPTTATTGSFTFTLVNQDGIAVAGIPVTISGASSVELSTDADGEVVVRGVAGDYSLVVPMGCTDTLYVLREARGRFGIAAGASGAQTVEVRWIHRYAPSGPVVSSLGPYWPAGEPVTMRFSVVDRCDTGSPREPGARFPTWRFDPGPTLKVVKAPIKRAGDDGFAEIVVRCTKAGKPTLVARDTLNPPDSVELVERDVSFAQPLECTDN